MQFIVVITFAQGHDALTGMGNVTQYLNANNRQFTQVGPTALITGGNPGTAAAAVGLAIANACLQAPDSIFVAEITGNTYQA